jgi:hypothetical protein
MANTVYRKTGKGQSEIETRAHRLVPRLRTALIMVDGRKTDEELAKLISGDAQAALAALLADAYIEVAALEDDNPAVRPAAAQAPAPAAASVPAQVPAQAPAPAPAPAAAPRKALPIDLLRHEAVRFLNDRMGPAAEGIAIKLGRAKTMAELRPLLVSAAQLLESFHGADAASAFADRFLADDAG